MGLRLECGGHWTGEYLIMDQEKLNNAGSVSSAGEPLRFKDITVPSHVTFPVKSGVCKHPEDCPVEFDIGELEADEDDQSSVEEQPQLPHELQLNEPPPLLPNNPLLPATRSK